VLIVDDDGGGAREVSVGESLQNLGMIWGSWDLLDGALTLDDLNDAAQSVIWITGDTSLSLDEDDRALISAYMDQGGEILVSGQEIAYDLCDFTGPHATGETIVWFINYMHATYQISFSTTLFVEGVTGSILGDGLSFGLQPSGDNAQTTPDVVQPGIGAETSFYYQGVPTWYGCTTWTDGSTHLVFMGFGVEGIIGTNRDEVISRILEWFGVTTTGIAGPQAAAPSFALAQNWPNPVRPSTSIIYRVDATGPVSLRIYDVNGRAVRTLVDRNQDPAQYSVVWDSKDDAGRKVASGVYFYKLEAGAQQAVRRLVVVR
jgi:hypothetical protein